MSAPWRRAAREVLRVEILCLARDRRALAAAVVLPLLAYPLFLGGRSFVERVSSDTLSAREVRVGLDLSAAPPGLAASLERLLGQEIRVELAAVDAQRLRALAPAVHEGRPEALEAEQRLARGLLERGLDALVTAAPHAVLRSRISLRLYHDSSSELSREASRRAAGALEALEAKERGQRVEAILGPADPGRAFPLEPVDVASSSDSGGALLGRFLPLLAVLVVVSAASYAALSTFAGEREAGTLETLLVQPVPPSAAAWGKFASVVLLATAALSLNVAGLAATLAFLPDALPGAGGTALPALAGGRLALVLLCTLPSVVLLSALLTLVSARARSFREGQHAILPLSIAAAAPAAFAGLGGLDLDPLLALVPILGPSLALRDALAGRLALVPAIAAGAASCGWAWLALRGLARTLDGERLLQTPPTELELEKRRTQSRTALRFGAAGALLGYLAAGALQGWRPPLGMLLASWLLWPGLSVASARGTARRAGEAIARTLGLVRPRAAHVLSALLCAPALALFVRAVVPWQERLLPMPARLLEGANLAWLLELSPAALFAVAALTPGVCEELFFRGAILAGLRKDLSARAVIGWQALLFGAAHASLYRFLPSALIGAALAALTLRARSLFPAIALHVAYDGLLVLGTRWEALLDPRLAWLALPGLLLFAARPPAARGTRLSLAAPAPERRAAA